MNLHTELCVSRDSHVAAAAARSRAPSLQLCPRKRKFLPFLFLLRLETHRDDGSSQREGEEGGAGHQSGSSGGRRRKRVWSLSHFCLLQRHLRPRHRPLRKGDDLPCDRWDEGEGGQRRVVSVRRHVGGSGRRSALQRARDHSAAHQAESHGRKQDEDSRPRSSVCSQSFGSIRHEDRTHR